MKIIEAELNQLNQALSETINNYPSEISQNIIDFLLAKSKRMKPALIFLTAKALDINISKKIMHLATASELIHSATLIHDDIIDDANTRRGMVSLNKSLGNNLSVLAGDLILTRAVELLSRCENFEILNTFTSSLTKMCNGEINQHFSLNKIPTIEEYILKSQNKTAELFYASLKSLCLLENISPQGIVDFATNFGIAFQLKDDLLNITNSDNSKPFLNDINNGTYTLCVIFLAQEKNISDLSKEQIINEINSNSKILDKTRETIKKYSNRAIDSLNFIRDNQYKYKLIELSENLYKAK